MKNPLLLPTVVFTLLSFNASISAQKTYVETENRYDSSQGQKLISGQIVRTFRSSDKKLVSELKKIINYNDDIKVRLMTGLSKKDGLSDYLLDSMFYDGSGNMIMQKTYVKAKGKWIKKQYYKKTYTYDIQPAYSKTAKPTDKAGSSKEIFYRYNDQGWLISETEVECTDNGRCDSLLKKQYYYNSAGKQESAKSFIWTERKWMYIPVRTVKKSG